MILERAFRRLMVDGFRGAYAVLALAGLCASLVTGSARAVEGVDDISLVKTAEPLVPATFARDVSVEGIKPGMTADEAKRQVRARYGDVVFSASDMDRVEVEYRGATLRSQPFVSELRAEPRRGHSLFIYLGPPSTGGIVIGVQWIVYNPADPDRLPTVEQTFAALHTEYGPESPGPRARTASNDGRSNFAFWLFGARELLPCQNYGCVPARGHFGFVSPEYRDLVREGRYLILTTLLSHSAKEPSRVDQTSVELEDVGNKLLAQEEAAKQMRAAADRQAGSPTKP